MNVKYYNQQILFSRYALAFVCMKNVRMNVVCKYKYVHTSICMYM